MHQKEKVVRTIKGKEEIVDFVFGSGILTANPPEVTEVNGGYKVMRKFGFSIKFSNGKDKKPSYYALELWGNNAEHMARLGYEGQLIEVAGRVKTSQYNSKQDGSLKELHTLTVERFTCLTRKGQADVSEGKVEDTTPSDTGSIEDEKESIEAPTTSTQELPSGIEEVVEGAPKDEFDDIPF